MTDRGDFPDAEEVVCTLAEPFGYACTALPEGVDLAELMPIILVARNGGPTDGITDRPVLQVGVMAQTRAKAWQVAGKLRDALLGSPGTAPVDVQVDSAREITGVSQLPDLDPMNRLVEATYVLSFRRKR